MINLTLPIECGERSCIQTVLPNMCKYLGTIRLGTIQVCRLFPSDDHSYTILEEDNFVVLRCMECMEAERT